MSEQATEPESRAPETGSNFGLLVGLPIMCAVILGAWALWRQTAELDDVAARPLAWDNVIELTQQHIELTLVVTVVVVCTAIPLGVMLTRPRFRFLSGPVVAVANAGQAAPVIGLIVLLAMWLSFGFWTAVLALSIYAFLPVLANTIVGLQQVDPTLVEAARGMGMSGQGVLRRVELPLALPVIMVGVRTALVLAVGTASFGFLINAGGLGSLIDVGVDLYRSEVLISGGLLIAVLALLIDWAGRVLEFFATPKGLR
ncbi:ABC transporter permease [Janibacter alkaliphilus]|uniref:Osmoprotectant transport system permease protein n=1 Tax=Janibacter alkaliphilus TaxID=1069963 RepID=A0A852XBT0_9MICO|nr:osmoprotectant transport system permease protein [Janibacter alkaliphilus]